MNSRKIVLELSEAMAKAFDQGQQQIELEDGARDSIQNQLAELNQALKQDAEYQFIGQDLVDRIFTMHPNIAHLVPRDLLWLLGGPSLNYLNDEELDKYYRLDELRHQAESAGNEFDWIASKSAIFNTQ